MSYVVCIHTFICIFVCMHVHGVHFVPRYMCIHWHWCVRVCASPIHTVDVHIGMLETHIDPFQATHLIIHTPLHTHIACGTSLYSYSWCISYPCTLLNSNERCVYSTIVMVRFQKWWRLSTHWLEPWLIKSPVDFLLVFSVLFLHCTLYTVWSECTEHTQEKWLRENEVITWDIY